MYGRHLITLSIHIAFRGNESVLDENADKMHVLIYGKILNKITNVNRRNSNACEVDHRIGIGKDNYIQISNLEYLPLV